jgi:hypothetical protein
VTPVAVRLLHAEATDDAGPLTRRVAAIRREIAELVAERFRTAGATDVKIVAGPPDDIAFGRRLRELVATERARGLVVAGSGSLALARRSDLAAFLEVAAAKRPRALANNRYSADVVAIACADRLLSVPDLPADNALPRWLAEVAGYAVSDLRGRRDLGFDVDSPVDAVLLGLAGVRLAPHADDDAAAAAIREVAVVAASARAELVVAGRTSAGTLRWLEDRVAARVRALIEERGLRAATRLAHGAEDPGRASDSRAAPGRARRPDRPPRSALGLVLDMAGPSALGQVLSELGDAAVVDTRVLLAHRFGADDRGWPPPEDRFASDLLLPDRVGDPWLRALTAAAVAAPIPIALGAHTLVGPGLPIALGGRR